MALNLVTQGALKKKPSTGTGNFTVEPKTQSGLLTPSVTPSTPKSSSAFQPNKNVSFLTPEQKRQNENATKYPEIFKPVDQGINTNNLPIGQRATSVADNVTSGGNALESKYQKTSDPVGTGSKDSGTSGLTSKPFSLTPTPQQNQQATAPQTTSANLTGGQGGGSAGGSGGGLYGQLVAGLAAKSLQPSDDYLKQQALANSYNKQLEQSRQAEAMSLYQNANPAGGYGRSIEYQQGAGALLQGLYANQQNALSGAFQGASNLLGAANTQQGLQQSGLTSAAGYAQPVGQYGALTDPITGVPVNSAIMSGPIQQAVQLVQNGADPQGSAVQSLLAPLGLAGQSQFTAAMQQVQGGGYNPSAQSAYTNQNLSQAASSQGEAYNLNLGLQQLKALQPVITNFLSTAGINSTTSPLYNQKINEYIGKLGNPAAMTQYAAMMSDLQKFASQMLAAGSGGTPTGVQAATELMNPGNLSMQQINSYLNTLDTLGANQIAVLQQQSQAAYGGQGGYAGNPAQVSSSTQVAAPGTALGSGVQGTAGQFAVGSGLNLASWAGNQLSSLGTELLAFMLGKR